ncbi:hypothetical protein BH23PLA1_BH23PLA1_40430 [soil metagenome]
MASIETYIADIADPNLRAKIAAEVAELKKRLEWGLVFEKHLPETTRLLSAPIKVGTAVWERRAVKPRRFRVRAIEPSELVVVPEPGKSTAPPDAPTERIARDNVLVEHEFRNPIFPAPASLGAIRNGPPDRPSHAVIQGENYHALQMLLAAYKGKVDVLYLDPPYNNGNRDWIYNNDYVDPTDTYRPSKWLAFMERRLRLARHLLKPDGVMVITADEHEAIHLGMLLEQTFPEANVQMATIVMAPHGIEQEHLSRAEEHAFFCFFGEATKPTGRGDDLLGPEGRGGNTDTGAVWQSLLRRGTGSARADRPTMFFPVLIDRANGRVVGVGDVLLNGDPDPTAEIDGYAAAWPIRKTGDWGRWRKGHATLADMIQQGFVKAGKFDPERRTWAISYLSDTSRQHVADGLLTISGQDARGAAIVAGSVAKLVSVKTVWHRSRHNAGVHGSDLLSTFLGKRAVFSFPKSLYAVKDTLDILTVGNPRALIMDFFAGSGTTLHATLLLNAETGGERRCVLITNNELSHDKARSLIQQGSFRGDPAYEAEGVFEAACRPRIEAALTGVRRNGQPIEGEYLDGRPYEEGFEENVDFFELRYIDQAEADLGLRYRELEPLLWLRAGGIGEREELDPGKPVGIPDNSPYAVVFDPSGIPELLRRLPERPDIKLVYIVAQSAESFAQISSELPHEVETVRLYRDYTETLRGAKR